MSVTYLIEALEWSYDHDEALSPNDLAATVEALKKLEAAGPLLEAVAAANMDIDAGGADSPHIEEHDLRAVLQAAWAYKEGA